ncbi:MAG: hypothetical protein K5685_04580 [Bacteroidales bacterium]|nr:hypothetical protein [Bacteroidales bacterium]
MYWILPIILGSVLAVINYFLMASGGDVYSQNFKIALVVDIVSVAIYVAIACLKIPNTQHKIYIAYVVLLCAVILTISCMSGTKKFKETFDKESYTVEAVLHKHIDEEWSLGRHYNNYMFNVKFRDKSGKEVVIDKEVDRFLVYDKYKDGDTILIKFLDKYPKYFEIVD